MSALDSLERIALNPDLADAGLRFCLCDQNKVPCKPDGSRARPNSSEDFCSLEELSMCPDLDRYAGIGISVNASKVCAIDIDKCFSVPFSLESGDSRAADACEIFAGKAYIEFSFSGKGMRILFRLPDIPDYSAKYYIKNDKTRIEYYQPSGHARYVTLTGRDIAKCGLEEMADSSALIAFLDKYMTRPRITRREVITCEEKGSGATVEELMRRVKGLYMSDIEFQDLWFLTEHEEKLLCHIQGKSRESHADFHLLSILFAKITQDKGKLKEIFESSPYFKSKDAKHMRKWEYNDFRYYDYIYDHLGEEI